jgi:hypothetical protein
LTPLNQIQLKKRQIGLRGLKEKRTAGNPLVIYILQATHLESIFCRGKLSVNDSNEWTSLQDTPKREGGTTPKRKTSARDQREERQVWTCESWLEYKGW